MPYKENPANLTINVDDILFFDFGPVFEDWEADLGRTYVLGKEARKLKLKQDVEEAWHIGKNYFDQHFNTLLGAQLYNFTKDLAYKMAWDYEVPHCGHLIGNFPHENKKTEVAHNYLLPDNDSKLCDPDKDGTKRYWIYEIHFIDKQNEIGGFFEQLVSGVD